MYLDVCMSRYIYVVKVMQMNIYTPSVPFDCRSGTGIVREFQLPHPVRLAYQPPQPTVLFSQNKSAISSQPAVLFSQNKPAPAISHQPNESDNQSGTKRVEL
jgi:hypothetical protein